MRLRMPITLLILMGLLSAPLGALAQEDGPVSVAVSINCAEVRFAVDLEGQGTGYDLAWDFGDGESLGEPAIANFPYTTTHIYPGQGEYVWTLTLIPEGDPDGAIVTSGVISLGPSTSLTSDPFPPLVTLTDGKAEIAFSAQVEGGELPYSFAWDLDGDGTADEGADPSSPEASFAFTEGGKFTAAVTVTDACGLRASDTLPVVVVDPESEAACHPTAQKIADAVNTLFPDQAGDLYTCADIFGFFTGDLTGEQLGFGRMWHAYQLALTIPGLSWEEILDWHLQSNGWGLLAQLDKFAASLEGVSVSDLVARVLGGETSVEDIRTAVRMATRYEADFEDALNRLALGASSGELSQFYRVVQELGVEPSVLDEHLEMGIGISDLRHAARMAESGDGDWAALAAAHAAGHSWGEIRQALKLSEESGELGAILEEGVREVRQAQREEERRDQQEERTAARLAAQFGVVEEQVTDLYQGECAQDWKCVRAILREREDGTATRLAAQFGVGVDQIWGLFNGSCDGDWKCVRAELREATRGERGRPNGAKGPMK